MSERFSNILSGKFQQVDPRQGVNVKVPDEAEFEAQKAEQAREIEASAPVVRNNDDLKEMISSLKSQIEELRASVDSIRSTPAEMPDMSAFVTTREQVKSLTNAIDRQNVEITNKQLVNAMGQISAMREDFFKLCSGMENKIDTMSAKEVLDSFRAYEVDMENILTDGGVFIGHFPYETLNTIHQRIVDVVPTDDPEKNGKIAERLSDGYKLGDRVLFKEKVSVWKYVESLAQETSSEEQPAPEEPAVTAEKPVADEVPAKPVKKTSSKKKKTNVKEDKE
ncbi:MAG: nucleotide exchange factor GrpE [Candidatus Methanomethylophilaceae archaeon]|nr:nucleotide exchange factor GrpE [Candidatus Methanomethylophilaceae archaeon]